MIRISPRLRHVSTATAILIAAPAIAEPVTPQPDASTPAADAAVSPRDPATGLPTGKRMHKPYTIAADPVPPPPPAGPQPTPYPNTGGTQERIVTSADPMEGGQVTSVTSSDPQEGGEIAHKHIAGVKYEDFKAADVQLLEVQSVSWAALSSDPEEGGQVAARRLRPGRPTYGDARIVTKEPTSVEVPNLAAGGDAQPRVSGGTAKVSVLLKACATGTHYPAVKISMRSGGPSHTLRDVTVTACNANGDGETQTCTLSYASLDQ